MSEYINNVTQRKETIKKILQELNAGRSVEDVKAEFGSLLEDADAPSITEVEQMMIEEGTPPEDIQRLCDIHTGFFRDSLDKVHNPDNLPGHPIHTFRMENEAAEEVLSDLEASITSYTTKSDLKVARVAFEFLTKLKGYEVHYVRKENLLFPLLEKTGFYGPSRVMWGIHNEVRVGWKKLDELLREALDSSTLAAAGEVQSVFEPMATAIREMYYKEDKILFPSALERLSEADWRTIRAQENEIGYFLVTPGLDWPPGARQAEAKPQPSLAAQPASNPVPAGLIPLSTGALAAEQVDMLLRSLPVDVTFVDENDEVRYFSQTRERIFQRSPAIIGRKVQNCHPPQSIGKVQQIVDDFRAGRRDSTEFWIQMGDKFVVIQYFAMRDADGKYRGALEVSQDASHLRSLQGERRLLDDGK
jgi:uncharacterized protein